MKDNSLEAKTAAETIMSICTDYLMGGQNTESFKRNIRMYSKFLNHGKHAISRIENIFIDGWENDDSGNHYDMLKSISEIIKEGKS